MKHKIELILGIVFPIIGGILITLGLTVLHSHIEETVTLGECFGFLGVIFLIDITLHNNSD